jgi:uncharacterized protein (TIGR02466 family)
MENLEIISLFPTPVLRVRVEEYFQDEIWKLKQLEMEPVYGNDVQPGNINHFKSVESYCLDLPGMEKLKEYIEKEVKDFYVHGLAIDGDIMITQSWVNKNINGGGTHTHYHNNSVISGVYYMDVPDNSTLIKFYKADVDKSTAYRLEPDVNSNLLSGNPYAQTVATIPVANHEILLFPSYLPHSVPVMDTNKDRWCLAFNTVPTTLGSKNTLTELLIKPNKQ